RRPRPGRARARAALPPQGQGACAGRRQGARAPRGDRRGARGRGGRGRRPSAPWRKPERGRGPAITSVPMAEDQVTDFEVEEVESPPPLDPEVAERRRLALQQVRQYGDPVLRA